ncbi:histidine phosphatase family protein [Nocardia beijingensis]|nr:histidine phosphatase family protein [Nocardia beijingensis]
MGRELELIAGAHPGETVVVVCHRASILAATQYFLEATCSRAHVSMEVDYTAITEWQLCSFDPEASGGVGLWWVLRRANDAEHLRPPLRGVTRRRCHSHDHGMAATFGECTRPETAMARSIGPARVRSAAPLPAARERCTAVEGI